MEGSEKQNDDKWIKNDDGCHICVKYGIVVGAWACLSPSSCFICQCKQRGVPDEKIVQAIYRVGPMLLFAKDLPAFTETTIENWEKEITQNIKG